MAIQFYSEETDFSLTKPTETSDWITEVIRAHDHKLSEISYVFCSDDYLLEINKEHLKHDYYTDIITFDNSEEEGIIESDIFISIDRVRENAQTQSTSFEHELNRVMIHGVLHLLGFGDKTEEQQKVMREKEDACLSLLKN
ncbi:rRNA maturation RNase YbeY [Ekhidna lutea]|uniref:Endoribonuclease YbeY n=1 Tax=Ekhidna lutea TaxID=447679 RepID=A0A239ENZ5_EKHLU|nr:rRNA maturation RNase YbeY [Ekhidna lutea]SNS46367.1 rRNA maturation RNase YbeY [Ekhidna lutea]